MRGFLGWMMVLMVSAAGWADVKLPALFADHMVLQRQDRVPVWGWAEPGETIAITASWGAQATARANDAGEWRTRLSTPAAGGPYTMQIKGKNSLEFTDILIGEVWLCSGQSNMGMTVSGCIHAKEEIAAANYPRIRLLQVKLTTADTPQKDASMRPWAACSPKTVPSFTAAGYFFGRKLYQELNIPIGLINSSWGGTCIEAWTPWESQADDASVLARKQSWDQRDAVFNLEEAKKRYEVDRKAWSAWIRGGKKGKAPRRPRPPIRPRLDRNYPSNLYNAMIHPLAPFAIRGVIWYQGEANAGAGAAYRVQLERLITSWRKLWQRDFPFYFVQLPNFRDPWTAPVENGSWAEIRESFMKTAKEVPGTGMAITIDIGEAKNIHPKNKQDVGDRLARLALHDIYGRTEGAWCGPVFRSCTFKDGKAIVTFDTGGAPLAVKGGGELQGFALTGANGIPVKAAATIVGDDTVEVQAPGVSDPCMVHYAWANNPTGVNLANADGLPASPFRFGQVPPFDVFAKLLPEEAAAYHLVYAFDPLAGRLVDGNTRFVYDQDRSATVTKPFRKVAYFLALQDMQGKVTYAFVSMDPFVEDAKKIGVPCKSVGARFQTLVSGGLVKSNVPDVVAGRFDQGLNIEFWDCNYGPANQAKVKGADDAIYDFGDMMGTDRSPGYGCMQIHNWKEKQSIICFNRFGAMQNNDVGIGNSSGKTRDWTFTSSAKHYARGQFLVLILP